MRFSESRAGTLVLTAEVTYTSGYRTNTPAREPVVLGTNTVPRIATVLPERGSSFLTRDSVLVQATGSDADGDPLVARLVAADGSLAAVDSSSPCTLYLDSLPLGSHAFTLELDDGNFAVAQRDYVVRVFDESSSIEAAVRTRTVDDDVDEREDGSIDATGDIDLGEKLAGLRFLPGLPADATVDSAYVQFVNQKDAQTGPNRFTIHAEASVDPATKRSAYAVDQRPELAPTLVVYYTAGEIRREIAAPTSLAFARVGRGGALTWLDPNDPLGEGYQVSLAGEPQPRLTGTARLELAGLVEGETYTARVRTIGRYGVRSSYSEPLDFSLGTSATVDRAPARLVAYPHPAGDRLTLVLPAELGDRLSAQILGASGAVLLEVSLPTDGAQGLDLAGLSAGLYTVRVAGAHGGVRVAPLVVR